MARLSIVPLPDSARTRQWIEGLLARAGPAIHVTTDDRQPVRAGPEHADWQRERTEERYLETIADTAKTEAKVHQEAAARSRKEAAAADRALRARKRGKSAKKK